MNILPLKEAYRLLKNCKEVSIFDGNSDMPTKPILSEIKNEEDNIFLVLDWIDGYGIKYHLQFTEGSNYNVLSKENVLYLLDKRAMFQDDYTQLTIIK